MLGFVLQDKFKYQSVDGLEKDDTVFFFGNKDSETKEGVYNFNPFAEGNKTMGHNVKKVIENTGLLDLLRKNVQVAEGLGKRDKADHVLNKKIWFIREMVDELGVLYLKYINRLMWHDQLDPTKNNYKVSQKFRWRETGISFDTALEFCKKLTQELSAMHNIMIDLRFNPKILEDRLGLDFDILVSEYKEKTGYVTKKGTKKKGK